MIIGQTKTAMVKGNQIMSEKSKFTSHILTYVSAGKRYCRCFVPLSQTFIFQFLQLALFALSAEIAFGDEEAGFQKDTHILHASSVINSPDRG